MLLPGGDYVAVQRVPSSDLAMFVNRAVDGMLPSPQWKLLPVGLLRFVEAYSGEGGRQRWAGVHHYEGRTSAMERIDPNLQAAVAKKTREELDLENLRGKCTGVTGTGDKVAQPQVLGMVLTEKEHFPPREGAARTRGLAAATQ